MQQVRVVCLWCLFVLLLTLCCLSIHADSDSTNLIQVAFPPASAVAEVLWSTEAITKSGPNLKRMHAHRCRMVQRGVPVPPTEIGFCPMEYHV